MHLALNFGDGVSWVYAVGSTTCLKDAVFLASMVDNLHHATRLRHEVDDISAVELCDQFCL